MHPEEFAKRLAAAIPRYLRCVLLYGSAAAGDFVAGVSRYNTLILVEALSVETLDALQPTIAAWCQAKNPTPLIFTTTEWSESADAFPIEWLDIRQSRRVLWGADLLEELTIDPRDLRLQVERELTGKLLALRGRYLLVAPKPREVEQLMCDSLSTFLVLFRAALRLYEVEVPQGKLEALQALTRHIAVDRQPFERLAAARAHSQSRSPSKFVVDVTFAEYVDAIEAVVHAINHLSLPPRSSQ